MISFITFLLVLRLFIKMVATVLVVLCFFIFAGCGTNFLPVKKLDPGYGNTIAYVGWSDDQSIFDGALNCEMLQGKDNAHLPIFKMDTLQELEEFKSKYDSIFTMEQGCEDSLSFVSALSKAQWDREAFYAEHTLVAVYIPANSGAFRYGVRAVETTSTSFCVYIEQKNRPQIVTDDMAGWFLLMEVEDEEFCKYSSFNAILDNVKKE